MLSFRISRCFCVLFLLSLVVVGCSGGPKYEGTHISGKVTLGGVPLDKGSIEFTAKSGVYVSAEIKNGAYKAENVGLGPTRVTIRATRETGKMNTEYSTPFPEVESIIPKKYDNGIDQDVKKVTKNLDFALESQ